MKEIRDIRIDFFDKDIQKEKDIELFMGDIALKFLIACKHLYLADTEILRVHIYSDISNIKREDTINGINISHPQWYGNFSDVSTVFSLKLFQRLTDTMQIHYIVRIIYNLFYRLSVLHNKQNLSYLFDAYLSCIKNNFIFDSNVFRQKNIKVILCNCRYLKYTDYFLRTSNDIFFLTKKERIPLAIWQKYTLDEMLNIPFVFKEKWINKSQLLLNWGKEKYIFDAEKKTIEIINNENSCSIGSA